MKLLTSNGMKNILKRILTSGELSEELENDLQRIQDDFTERETILKDYGTIPDDEGLDEFEFEASKQTDSGGSEWEQKYRDMKQKYVDRFFNGSTKEANNETNNIKPEQENQDVEQETDEPLTFDALLETEG